MSRKKKTPPVNPGIGYGQQGIAKIRGALKPCHFACDYPEVPAVKVKLDGGLEWVIKPTEFQTRESFGDEHRTILDGILAGKPKTIIAEALGMDYKKVSKIVSAAKGVGLL